MTTIYEFLVENNKNNLNDIAIETLEEKISYKELLNNIDLTAKALLKRGIKKGDVVGICLDNCKEAIYFLYALSKIGATARFIDFDNIKGFLGDNKLLVVDDHNYRLAKGLTKQDLIVVQKSKFDIIGKLMVEQLLVDDDESYKKFIENGKEIEHKDEEFEDDIPAAIVYESGREIVLSNKMLNEASIAYEKELEPKKGDRFYGLDLSWNLSKIMTTIHFPLSLGLTSIINQKKDRKSLMKIILRKRPKYVAAPSFMLDSFLNDKIVKEKRLDFLKGLIQIGKPLRQDQAQLLECKLEKYNCFASLIGQYINPECGLVSVSKSPYESVGKAVKKIQIVDESNNQLQNNERGRLVINADESNKVQTDKLASIDDEGNLYIYGNSSDYLLRNGIKIYTFDIKRIIEARPGIQACDVKISNGSFLVTIKFTDYYMNDFNYNDRLMEANLIAVQRAIYSIYEDESIIPCFFNVVADAKTELYISKEKAITEYERINQKRKILK